MATKKRQSGRGRTWVRVLTHRDLDELRTLLPKGDEKRGEWEYKLYRDNIIISVPVIPGNSATKKPDPSAADAGCPGGEATSVHSTGTMSAWRLGVQAGQQEPRMGLRMVKSANG